ncbi:hypothetical protein BO78DRAFT_346155 [Aspergillus sclerotiicarbonarius CBS 121057]|uniref:Lysophospholipase n=1 Tax=Aspergillus sclerotiicarbonarius (strain CBS 121057 / IBT 28362) TaxID=1448318 RepID=A0A319EAU3_ASPSB|nr:hypothetical protein BO78DRAFT_346155 [Aspergillus sclerotiicarbonarius CBS 121057]
MKETALLASIFLGVLPYTLAFPSPVSQGHVSRDMSPRPRALPDAPNGYAPVHVTCPATRPRLRSASTLSPEEISWLDTRRSQTVPALKDFFGHVEIDDFDAVSYLERHSNNSASLPNIGIAISGGGFRAMLNGAGAIKAFDNRTEGATAKGQLGGLLQSATYVAALSGGSWMLASVVINNFTTIAALQEDVWDLSSPNIFYGPASMEPADYWGNITAQVKAKKAAGFVTSDADIWGRMEGYYFFNASHGGVDLTWSSIAKTKNFQHGEMPLPLVVVDGQYFNLSGEEPTLREPVYEFSPWEFGTYDDSIHGFAPLEYLGTRFVDGVVPENETCVRGYDNAGFITGTSSDIWNENNGYDIAATLRGVISELSTNTTEGTEAVQMYSAVLKEFLSAVSSNSSVVNGPAAYDPNPFYQYNKDSSPFAQDTRLTVVDGGEDEQNIPLEPLIQRKRNVDVIFAVDSSVQPYWPNGTSLISTYERVLAGLANDTSFPSIPDAKTFVNLGLNSQPTFFGCNSSNLTTPAPLVVYLPNHPVTYMSNVSQEVTSYNTSRRDAMIINGYNIATQANGTLDADWTTCVGCAILSRSFDRTDTTVPEACSQCFQHYCWNGTIDNRTPSAYDPNVLLPSSA